MPSPRKASRCARSQETIGRRLNLPVASITPEEAADYYGWFAAFAAMDMPASSAWTRQTLGWEPTGPDLMSDMEAHYFALTAAGGRGAARGRRSSVEGVGGEQNASSTLHADAGPNIIRRCASATSPVRRISA